MAYTNEATWIHVSPTSGSGDGTLSIKADAHTGRVARSYGNGTNSGVKVSCGILEKYIKVSQAAKAEYVSFDQTSYSVSAVTQTITITGKSNAAKLTFTLKGYNSASTTTGQVQTEFYASSQNQGTSYKSETASKIGFQTDGTSNLQPVFTAAGSTQHNNTNLSGDPGASAEYSFSITLTFDSNNTSTAQEKASLSVAGSSSSISASTSIVRNDGATTLSLGSSSVELVAEGTAKTVSIDSNGSWTVS